MRARRTEADALSRARRSAETTKKVSRPMTSSDRTAPVGPDKLPPTVVEPPGDPLVGKTLDGRFVPRALLGRGGMGRVYLAEDLRLKRRVALKLMDARLAADEEFSRRFKREAIVQAQAPHPGIVQVLDVGECAEGAYIVLEYSEGKSLAQLLRVGPFRLGRALDLIEQLLDVLDFAHRQNVVHRDLKPGNILVEERGGRETLRVLDFGIAKLLQAERHDEGATLTQPGFGFGTPGYMPLEQATGRPTDHRADVFAAGVIAYQMLGGAPPFRADSVSDYLVKLASTVPEPLAVSRPELGVPPELDAILLRALAREPEARFASALHFLEAVREFRRGAATTDVATRPVSAAAALAGRRPGAGRGPTLVAGLAAAVATVAAVWFAGAAADAKRALKDASSRASPEAAAARERLAAASAALRSANVASDDVAEGVGRLSTELAAARAAAARAEGEARAADERAGAESRRAQTAERDRVAEVARRESAEREAAAARAAAGAPSAATDGLREELATVRSERDRAAGALEAAEKRARTAEAAATAAGADVRRLEGELAAERAKPAPTDGAGETARAELAAKVVRLEGELARAKSEAATAPTGVWRLRVENQTGGALDVKELTLYFADGAGQRAVPIAVPGDGRLLGGKSFAATASGSGAPLRAEGRIARSRPGSAVPGAPEVLRRTEFVVKDGELVLSIK